MSVLYSFLGGSIVICHSEKISIGIWLCEDRQVKKTVLASLNGSIINTKAKLLTIINFLWSFKVLIAGFLKEISRKLF